MRDGEVKVLDKHGSTVQIFKGKYRDGYLYKFKGPVTPTPELDDPFDWTICGIAHLKDEIATPPKRLQWVKDPGCMETFMGYWDQLFGRIYVLHG